MSQVTPLSECLDGYVGEVNAMQGVDAFIHEFDMVVIFLSYP